MLKRRYGENWHKYIAYDEDLEFDDFWDEDDYGSDDMEDDFDDNAPL